MPNRESGRAVYSRRMKGLGKSLALAAGALCVSAIGCGPGSEGRSAEAIEPAAAAKTAAGTPAEFEAELLRRVNEHRISKGLTPLLESPELTSVARDHSVDMIARKYFAHLSPEMRTAGGRLTTAGITWSYAGENLAEGLTNPRAVLEAWLLSPSHRDNLERHEWTHAGVGVALGEEGSVVTQLFLRP